MKFDDHITQEFERLAVGELTVRESFNGAWHVIAKSKKAMTGPWGGGVDKDVPNAIRLALESLDGELQHEANSVKAFAKGKPEKRREDFI